MASYISTFNEYAALVDWNEFNLVERFRGGLKDDILDLVATTEAQPRRLQHWMAMASRIDERLWGRRQHCRWQSDSYTGKPLTSHNRNAGDKFQANQETFGLVPIELGAVRTSTALGRTAVEH